MKRFETRKWIYRAREIRTERGTHAQDFPRGPRWAPYTAVGANASPFAGLVVPVAFYHSASKNLLGVAQAGLVATETGDPGLTAVNVVGNGPVPSRELD
jgi:hypothetical protein